jgi:hypothetical protein
MKNLKYFFPKKLLISSQLYGLGIRKKLIPDSGSKKLWDPRTGFATLVILDGKRQKMHTYKSTHLSSETPPSPPLYNIFFIFLRIFPAEVCCIYFAKKTMHAQNKILFATKMCIIGSDANTQATYLNFLTV